MVRRQCDLNSWPSFTQVAQSQQMYQDCAPFVRFYVVHHLISSTMVNKTLLACTNAYKHSIFFTKDRTQYMKPWWQKYKCTPTSQRVYLRLSDSEQIQCATPGACTDNKVEWPCGLSFLPEVNMHKAQPDSRPVVFIAGQVAHKALHCTRGVSHGKVVVFLIAGQVALSARQLIVIRWLQLNQIKARVTWIGGTSVHIKANTHRFNSRTCFLWHIGITLSGVCPSVRLSVCAVVTLSW